MDHIAIMKPQWHLIPKILGGEKTVESRWYTTRRNPWDKVNIGDTLYFKNSSSPIEVLAEVTDVVQFVVKTNAHAMRIMKQYAKKDLGISTIPDEVKIYITNKRYAIFISFSNVKKVEAFNIDKTGFGAMSAWICIKDIRKIIS
ncbi:hypothetical protein IPM62_05865 [Candidatus Woesebacteria bacterium]|nr:MAG: hypothetical protein IPM62_05865 [Candidatus Woesebacteria bacterium]